MFIKHYLGLYAVVFPCNWVKSHIWSIANIQYVKLNHKNILFTANSNHLCDQEFWAMSKLYLQPQNTIYIVIRMVTCLVVTLLHTFERKIFFSIKWWEKHHHNLLKAKQSSIKIYLEKWKSYYINNFMVPTAFSLYSSIQPF